MVSIKVPKPHLYSGTGTDCTKSKLLSWTDSIERYIIAAGGTKEDNSINTAACFLTDVAETWFRTWKKDNEKGSYQKLTEDMQKNFVPSTTNDLIYQKWERISQIKEGKVRPITQVAAELQDLALQLSDMSNFIKQQDYT